MFNFLNGTASGTDLVAQGHTIAAVSYGSAGLIAHRLNENYRSTPDNFTRRVEDGPLVGLPVVGDITDDEINGVLRTYGFFPVVWMRSRGDTLGERITAVGFITPNLEYELRNLFPFERLATGVFVVYGNDVAVPTMYTHGERFKRRNRTMYNFYAYDGPLADAGVSPDGYVYTQRVAADLAAPTYKIVGEAADGTESLPYNVWQRRRDGLLAPELIDAERTFIATLRRTAISFDTTMTPSGRRFFFVPEPSYVASDPFIVTQSTDTTLVPADQSQQGGVGGSQRAAVYRYVAYATIHLPIRKDVERLFPLTKLFMEVGSYDTPCTLTGRPKPGSYSSYRR